MRQTILAIALILAALSITGCGDITRAEYERANADRQTQVIEIKLPNGDRRVAYRGLNPQIDPATHTYTCPSGIRIVDYRDGVIVARWWQDDAVLAP